MQGPQFSIGGHPSTRLNMRRLAERRFPVHSSLLLEPLWHSCSPEPFCRPSFTSKSPSNVVARWSHEPGVAALTTPPKHLLKRVRASAELVIRSISAINAVRELRSQITDGQRHKHRKEDQLCHCTRKSTTRAGLFVAIDKVKGLVQTWHHWSPVCQYG